MNSAGSPSAGNEGREPTISETERGLERWLREMAGEGFDDFAAGTWDDYRAARERALRRRPKASTRGKTT